MRLVSVGKRYGRGPWLFEEVFLEIEPGRSVAIDGANGSGKSTLLNLLAGLTRPTVGTMTPPPRRVGYLPERFPATSRMSAAAYLTHMGRIRGLSPDQAARTGEALLDRFQFNSGRSSALRILSKGNAQKVALAQALLLPPELLILDEPWTGLDAAGCAVLAEIITEVSAAGAMVVLSTHPGVAAPAVPATRYLLAAGALAPVADVAGPAAVAGPSNRVLIRRGAGSTELPTAWSAQYSVSGIDRAVLICTVPMVDCDSFLLDCLHRGWSVIEVGPADSPLPGWRTDPAADDSAEPGASS